MFGYIKLLSCLLFVSCHARVIRVRDSKNGNDAPNLFNLPGVSENSARGATFIEGDIAVPLKGDRTAHLRSPKWSNGIVPVEFDSSYNTTQKNVITGAMNDIMTNTGNCIKFVSRDSSSTVWLRIHPGSGCWSYKGQSTKLGAQDLSLQIPGCIHHGVVLHELLHALGFIHEHTRPDRDSFIRVYYENVLPNFRYAFDTFPRTDVNTFDEPYDYGSIMHYSNDGFSSNGKPTIEVINPGYKNWERIMGRGDKMSDSDIKKLKQYYSCP